MYIVNSYEHTRADVKDYILKHLKWAVEALEDFRTTADNAALMNAAREFGKAEAWLDELEDTDDPFIHSEEVNSLLDKLEEVGLEW